MKPTQVTITHAATLYAMAKECRSESIGAPATDPAFEDTHITYQDTFFRLAQRLVAQGWRPKKRKATRTAKARP